MSLLLQILLACLCGGVLSVLLAAMVAWHARPTWIPALVSFAVGTLLGAAFLEVIPHLFEESKNHQQSALYILGGILLFFILEKMVIWRHSHDHDHAHIHVPVPVPVSDVIHSHSHAHSRDDRSRSGLLIIIGDTFHNFTDGIVIAAAFIADPRLGWVTALAIIAHEIPQEIGDFIILLHSGYSKKRALLLNVVSSLATFVGAMLAYFALSEVQNLVPVCLGLAAASMLYIAVADLIPALHKRSTFKESVVQILLIGSGLATIGLVRHLSGAH
jgi:zinc and cadmium transporter